MTNTLDQILLRWSHQGGEMGGDM